MHTRALFLALLFVAVPTCVEGQGITDLMMSIRDGGGWVRIPIEGGEGAFRTATLPTAALSLVGCVNVWHGHSGTWRIDARESVLGSVLRIDAEPGVGVPFSHDFGLQAQVDFDFRWSEPRDTTLMLWIGLDFGSEGAAKACQPNYGSD